MTNFHRADDGRSEAGDPALDALLRAAYAAPTSERYWADFEQRVLARLNDAHTSAWWSVFADVRTVGLVAATLALLLAGAAMVRERALDLNTPSVANGVAADTSYDAALQRALDGDAVTFTSSARRRLPADAPERYLNPLDW